MVEGCMPQSRALARSNAVGFMKPTTSQVNSVTGENHDDVDGINKKKVEKQGVAPPVN